MKSGGEPSLHITALLLSAFDNRTGPPDHLTTQEATMQKLAFAVAGALIVLQSACSDNQPATAPRIGAAASALAADERGADLENHEGRRLVSILDACDGPSFMANGVACARAHGVTFQQFIAELTNKQTVGAWRFAPPTLTLERGERYSAINRGGETHTFTKVAHFGGGIVPALNQLSGNPVPAEACTPLGPSDFIPPGGISMTDVAGVNGTELYQCCIHPWMRAVVTVKRS
jgi:hypothetical protein